MAEKPVNSGLQVDRIKEAKNKYKGKLRKILVPHNLSKQIINSRSERQILSTFLRLKGISKSGVLTYAKSLAGKVLISWNTFKKRLKLLIESGLIRFENNKLFLQSWEYLKEKYNLKHLNYYTCNFYENIEHKLIELSIRDNFKDQKKAIEKNNKLYVEKYASTVEEVEQVNEMFKTEKIKLSQKTIGEWLGSLNYQAAQYYLYWFESLGILVNERQKPKFHYQDKKTGKRYFKDWPVNIIRFCEP